MVALAEMLKERFFKPGLWMLAVLVTAGLSLAAYVTGGGAMFSPGPLSEKSRGRTLLMGVSKHADLATNCAACHAPPVGGASMAERCMECHANIRSQLDKHGPMHGKIENAENCRSCHTEHKRPHAGLTSFATFNHDWTAFKLTGQHVKADCAACHKTEAYQGTPQSCVSCHAEPAVHKGRFGTNCVECHATATWVIAGGPGMDLKNFDHDQTGFKLTGKHASTDCRQCHVNNTFKGTSKSCVSCHAEPVVHKGRFGTLCADCHSTDTWSGAVFKHTVFPILHHNRDGACVKCHNDSSNFQSYTCYNCHHTQAREAARHKNRKVTTLAELDNCIKCHARDKKGRRADARPHGDACPELAVSGGCPGGFDTPGTDGLARLASLLGDRLPHQGTPVLLAKEAPMPTPVRAHLEWQSRLLLPLAKR